MKKSLLKIAIGISIVASVTYAVFSILTGNSGGSTDFVLLALLSPACLCYVYLDARISNKAKIVNTMSFVGIVFSLVAGLLFIFHTYGTLPTGAKVPLSYGIGIILILLPGVIGGMILLESTRSTENIADSNPYATKSAEEIRALMRSQPMEKKD